MQIFTEDCWKEIILMEISWCDISSKDRVNFSKRSWGGKSTYLVKKISKKVNFINLFSTKKKKGADFAKGLHAKRSRNKHWFYIFKKNRVTFVKRSQKRVNFIMCLQKKHMNWKIGFTKIHLAGRYLMMNDWAHVIIRIWK